MRLVTSKPALKRILRWTQGALLTCAIPLLAYCGLELVDSWSFQTAGDAQLEHLLRERSAASAGWSNAPAPLAEPVIQVEPVIRNLLGRMEIPRLELSVMVVEGTSRTDLRRAAGHIAGTSLPGTPGNVGIAGHRDRCFRSLRNIRRDDKIVLTTTLGEYHYRVVSTAIVSPTDIEVLDAGNGERLTLITCFPFYFVGDAPERFVVRAERTQRTID